MKQYIITAKAIQEIMECSSDGWEYTHFKEGENLYIRFIRGAEEKEFSFPILPKGGEDGCLTDKALIGNIFQRLADNFMNLNNPMMAMTDSEVAADSLAETLYNIGLDSEYERVDGIDENGIWYAKFEVNTP